jgi:hypothetical protein
MGTGQEDATMFRKLMVSLAGLATVACMVLPGAASAEGFRERRDRDDFRYARVVRDPRIRIFPRWVPAPRFARYERFDRCHRYR